MKRIAVCGKGGSGKTTISGTFARLSGRRLGQVLAIDGDPNPNLARVIGIEGKESWELIPRDLLTTVEVDGERRAKLARPIQEIVSEFAIEGPDGVILLTMGEVDHAGEGWLCRTHATVREIVGATLEDGKYPVVLDMEASVEHMRRNTVRHIDSLFIVVEPYYRALEAGARLFRLAAEIPIKNVYVIANKVRNTAEESAIRTFCEQRQMPILAVIPYDESVGRADLMGKALIDSEPTASSVQAIERLVAEVFA